MFSGPNPSLPHIKAVQGIHPIIGPVLTPQARRRWGWNAGGGGGGAREGEGMGNMVGM